MEQTKEKEYPTNYCIFEKRLCPYAKKRRKLFSVYLPLGRGNDLQIT